MIGMRKKLDFEALDWRKAAEVERARRQLGNLATAIAGLERQEGEIKRQIDALGPNLDAILDALGETGDVDGLIEQRRQLRMQREAHEGRLREVRGLLRDQEQLRRELEAAVERAIGKARAARYEKVEAAYRATAEALAKMLKEAAGINADLQALRDISGGVAGWPSPWPELRLDIHSGLGMWLRDAAEFGCRVDAIEEVVDQAAVIGARYNRRQQRKAEIEAKAEEIRTEEGRAAAERYLATATVEE